jgi:hypothetical protein
LVAVIVSGVIGLGLTTPFVLREAEAGFGGDTRRTGQVEAAWLNSHYHGGNILFTYLGDPSVMFYLMTQYGFSDTTFITDSNGSQFDRAIAHPERSVRWIILDVANKGNRDDRLLNMLEQHSEWRQRFVLRKRFTEHLLPGGGRAYGAVEIYQKVDITSAPGALAASPPLPHS